MKNSYEVLVEQKMDEQMKAQPRGAKDWMTPEILARIAERDRLFQKMKENPEDKSINEDYKRVRNIVVTLTRRAKRDYKQIIKPQVEGKLNQVLTHMIDDSNQNSPSQNNSHRRFGGGNNSHSLSRESSGNLHPHNFADSSRYMQNSLSPENRGHPSATNLRLPGKNTHLSPLHQELTIKNLLHGTSSAPGSRQSKLTDRGNPSYANMATSNNNNNPSSTQQKNRNSQGGSTHYPYINLMPNENNHHGSNSNLSVKSQPSAQYAGSGYASPASYINKTIVREPIGPPTLGDKTSRLDEKGFRSGSRTPGNRTPGNATPRSGYRTPGSRTGYLTPSRK